MLDATTYVFWQRDFISGLGVVDTIIKSLKYYDNVAAIFFMKKC